MADQPVITEIETIQFEWIDPRSGGKVHPSLPHATAIRVATDQGVTGAPNGCPGRFTATDSVR